MINFLKKLPLVGLTILFGTLLRLYLIFTLPAWHDEIYSVWASTQSLRNIILGISDPVHLPGYYLFLKLWSLISDHLVWLRLSSVIGFAINCILLYKLLKEYINEKFAFISLFCYVFSGYFIIFDWQIRMYTLSTTLMLASLYFWKKAHSWNFHLILFVLVTTSGLWFDYSFYWYFMPFFVFAFISEWKGNHRHKQYRLISLLASLIGLAALAPIILITFNAGSSGIFWMKQYAHPAFSVPYYLGSHQNIILSILYFYLTVVGIYLGIKSKIHLINHIHFFAYTSLIFTILVSLTWRMIFHIRSLQILGISIIIAIAFSVLRIHAISKYIAYGILIVIFLNNIFIFSSMYSRGGFYMVDYFPWKKVIQTFPKTITHISLVPQAKLPSPVFLWGLEYSLNGKEAIEGRSISYSIEDEEKISAQNCTELYNFYIAIYECKN